MKKLISFLIFFIILFSSNIYYLNASNNNKIETFVNYLYKKDKVENILSINNSDYKKYLEKKDQEFMNIFNWYSINEKHIILQKIRERNIKTEQDKKLNEILVKIQNKLEKENKFILDVNEKDLITMLKENSSDKNYINLLSWDCPFYTYPYPKYYMDKPTWKSHYNALEYRLVKNDINETFCDTEIRFWTTANYLWTDNALTRLMITQWFWWKLDYKISNWNTYIIVWRIRMIIYWINNPVLRNSLKIFD